MAALKTCFYIYLDASDADEKMEFLKRSEAQLEKLEKIKTQIYELTDFLVNVLKVDDLGAQFPYKVTFHDACSALREYGVKDEPRQLLSKVKGLELIEMDESETCCGFGGTFAVKHAAISVAIFAIFFS